MWEAQALFIEFDVEHWKKIAAEVKIKIFLVKMKVIESSQSAATMIGIAGSLQS